MNVTFTEMKVHRMFLDSVLWHCFVPPLPILLLGDAELVGRMWLERISLLV